MIHINGINRKVYHNGSYMKEVYKGDTKVYESTYNLIPGSRIHSGYTSESEPLEYYEEDSIIIENKLFDGDILGSTSTGIELYSCNNVVIRNCKFINFIGTDRRGIAIYSSGNIDVYNCDFEDVTQGIHVENGSGYIKIFNNDFLNIHTSGGTNGEAIRFMSCSGPGNRISYNAIENILGQSSLYTGIRINQCNFSESDPIRVSNNWLRGGRNDALSIGIIIGANGGFNQVCEHNIIVNLYVDGLIIHGTDNQFAYNNLMFTTGALDIPLSADHRGTGTYGNNNWIYNNRYNWRNASNTPIGPWWGNNQENINKMIGLETNIQDDSLDASILPSQIIGIEENPSP